MLHFSRTSPSNGSPLLWAGPLRRAANHHSRALRVHPALPSAPYGSSEFLLTRLAQEAVTRTSPVPQGGTMARGGRVTDLYSRLVSGGGEALNPHCGTRVGKG